eukprot:SAG31_NODE_14070_length_829_cov_0.768493_2_plen_136_part_00
MWSMLLVCDMDGLYLRAYTARRAEHAQAESAAAQHAQELSRQRGHEQMISQLKRTDRVRQFMHANWIAAVLNERVYACMCYAVAGRVLPAVFFRSHDSFYIKGCLSRRDGRNLRSEQSGGDRGNAVVFDRVLSSP